MVQKGIYPHLTPHLFSSENKMRSNSRKGAGLTSKTQYATLYISMKTNLGQLINKVLAVLTPREREVVEKRWGLKDGQVLTLAEVGYNYGITRERVRQIEAGALDKLQQLVKTGGLKDFFATVDSHLKVVGGLRRESLLLDDLKFLLRESSIAGTLGNKVKLLLDLSKSLGYSPEDGDFHSYWFVSPEERQKAIGFVNKLVKFLEKNKQALMDNPATVKGVIKEAAVSYNLKEAVALNYISLSKHFHVSQYGDFGLAKWSEVNPTTVRHWAYLVLRKEKKPLHFMEIAKAINRVRKEAKLANAQTVHNELIKDGRFVLVGRGMYGLQEFGLMPGTARDVIGRLLKTHGPQRSKELLKLVKKERVFKDNTVFINLQNKKHFQRLPDGRYDVKEV